MKKVAKQTGVTLAAAAAVLFATTSFADAAATSTAKTGPVHCMGINSCKGMGECNTATHACGGFNSCKGKGWITVASAKVCKDKGGTVVE